MLKIAALLLALVFVDPSPEPTAYRPVLGQPITVDGNEVRAITAACAELPRLMKIDCASSDMSRFEVDVLEESEDYRVVLISKGRIGGGIAIFVSNTSFKVTKYDLLY